MCVCVYVCVFKNVEICNFYHYLVGECHKKVKLSITFRYKSLMFTLFLQKRNFSTSQTRKKSFFFNQRQLPKACWFWTIVKQKNVLLSCTITLLSWQKEKKRLISFVVFCFLHFENLEEKTTLTKTKQKSVVFFPKASVLCFVFGYKQNLPFRKILDHLNSILVQQLYFKF